jgi:hypothetical protein
MKTHTEIIPLSHVPDSHDVKHLTAHTSFYLYIGPNRKFINNIKVDSGERRCVNERWM